MPDEEKQRVVADPLEQFLFPEQTAVETEPELDSTRISFEPDNLTEPETADIVLSEIETMAEEQNAELEAIIQQVCNSIHTQQAVNNYSLISLSYEHLVKKDSCKCYCTRYACYRTNNIRSKYNRYNRNNCDYNRSDS